jgi:pimeloyl-ACP methyl ester carboxylesterase
MPSRVKGLILYEPVLFSLLLRGQGTHPADLEVRSLRDDVVRAMDRGDTLSAARRFVEYWVGENSWDTIPLSRRQIMLDGMLKVRAEWDTPFTDDTPLETYRQIDVPTMLLHGADSPASMHRLADLMGRLFPRAQARQLDGIGHMGPITHPMRINRLIQSFLFRADPPRSIAA